jgi:hypothetical protein
VLADLVKAFGSTGRSFLTLAGAVGTSDGFRFASAPR